MTPSKLKPRSFVRDPTRLAWGIVYRAFLVELCGCDRGAYMSHLDLRNEKCHTDRIWLSMACLRGPFYSDLTSPQEKGAASWFRQNYELPKWNRELEKDGRRVRVCKWESYP